MDEAYEIALEKAITELAALDSAAEELERKRAKVRQGILVLRSMLGLEGDNEQSLTDAILNVMKASTGFITAPMVADRLIMAGYQVQIATVATILSRMLKDNQLEKGPAGGYRWAGIPKWAEEFGAKVAEGISKVGARESALPAPQIKPRRRIL